MRALEKFGWVIFLVSLVICVISAVYAFIREILHFVIEFLKGYHHNAGSVALYFLLAAVVGVILIRIGSSEDSQDI